MKCGSEKCRRKVSVKRVVTSVELSAHFPPHILFPPLPTRFISPSPTCGNIDTPSDPTRPAVLRHAVPVARRQRETAPAPAFQRHPRARRDGHVAPAAVERRTVARRQAHPTARVDRKRGLVEHQAVLHVLLSVGRQRGPGNVQLSPTKGGIRSDDQVPHDDVGTDVLVGAGRFEDQPSTIAGKRLTDGGALAFRRTPRTLVGHGATGTVGEQLAVGEGRTRVRLVGPGRTRLDTADTAHTVDTGGTADVAHQALQGGLAKAATRGLCAGGAASHGHPEIVRILGRMETASGRRGRGRGRGRVTASDR